MSVSEPGPLVSGEWLAQHLVDPDLRLVHVSVNRDIYDEAHIPGAAFSDLHVDMAKSGTSPNTGPVRRVYLVPSREDGASSLASWGVAPGSRLVFYDDSQGRHAIRGYWLMRLYRFPRERVHVLDGGLPLWRAQGRPATADVVTPHPAAVTEPLGDRDDSLIATAEDVLAWSREAAEPGGPTRLLDVRRIDEFLGLDVMAARGGRIAGSRHRLFTEFVAPDGRLRSAEESLAILRGSGVNPGELRAVYCQGGIRSSLAWFALHEIAGLDEVRNYAASWEEWGSRLDLPVER
jgi:thiosulfate/3-mercaptopyruvate sulfurtransferase